MTVRLWNPVMQNGIINFQRPEECRMVRHIKDMSIKSFGIESNNFMGLMEFGEEDGSELDE